MELNLIEIAAQYGVMGGLLFAVMYWLVKHYLPGHERQHQAELERILRSHDYCVDKLASAVERNTRVVQFNSQALLVLGLMRGGLSRDEAEEIAESVRLSTLNGGGSADGSQHP
jgi:hypothetical protein